MRTAIALWAVATIVVPLAFTQGTHKHANKDDPRERLIMSPNHYRVTTLEGMAANGSGSLIGLGLAASNTLRFTFT